MPRPIKRTLSRKAFSASSLSELRPLTMLKVLDPLIVRRRILLAFGTFIFGNVVKVFRNIRLCGCNGLHLCILSGLCEAFAFSPHFRVSFRQLSAAVQAINHKGQVTILEHPLGQLLITCFTLSYLLVVCIATRDLLLVIVTF